MTPQRRPSTREPASAGFPLILQAWVGSRGLLLLVALWVCVRYGARVPDVFANWDVQHFLELARQGYTKPTDPAFFPGLPLLLRGLGRLGIPMVYGGMVVSLLCSLLAALALWRLGGRRTGPWAAAAWLIAPTAVFTFVPYTEALFCALAFWAWERARERNWFAMAVLAALACTVRVSGLFLVGALFIELLTRRHESGRERGRSLAWLLLPVATLLAYVVYQWRRTGDWLAWYHAQTAGWARGFTTPLQSFRNTLPPAMGAYADHPGWDWIFRGEIASMAIGILVTLICLARRRWGEASWVGVQVLAFSLSYWWMSVNRAVLLWFPLWLLIAEIGCWRPRNPGLDMAWRIIVAILTAVCAVVAMIWAALFYLGMWAS